MGASFALPSPRSRNVGTLDDAGTGSGCGSGSAVSSTGAAVSTTGGFGFTGARVAVSGGTTAADDVVTGTVVVVAADVVAVSTSTEVGGVTWTDVCDGFAVGDVVGIGVVVLAVVAGVVRAN